MSRLLRFLGIQSGEGRLAAGLFSYSFFLGVGRIFVLTASQALFLQFYPASDLAYVYMIAALATIATSAAYLRLGRRLSPRDLILANLLFTTAVTLSLRLLLGATGGGWPVMALAAWFHVMFALSSFAFWGAATQVLDIRQGKRLFPVATTGDVLAFSVGGFVILRSVGTLGTANLLWIGVAGFALAIAGFLVTLSHSSMDLAGATRTGARPRERTEVRWSSPYLRLMMAYFILSAVVFVFLDNAFNDVAQRRFEGAVQLARFFATYSALAAIVNFLFRSTLAGRLVRRFGMILGLLILPAAVGLGAASVGLAGTLLPGLGLVFWLTTTTRLSDKVLRGVQQSSMATLYQPLMEKGPAVQTTMDGIIDSAAIGLAGATLLLLHRLFDMSAVELSYFLVAFCGLWVVVAVGLKREFVQVLGGALLRRRLRSAEIEIVDDDVLRIVREQLDSEYPEQVVYALGLLAGTGHEELREVLGELLEHPSEDVRLEVLRHIEELRMTGDRDRVAALVRDPGLSGDLRGAAARTLGQLSDEIPGEVLEALRSDLPELRRGAMVGLLRSGSIEGVVYAGAELLEDLRSESAEARTSGAEVLRAAAIPNFFRQAIVLLEDPEPGVRARAVEAAAAMDHPVLWPLVVEILRDHQLAPVASEVLLKAGPAAIPFLAEGFERDTRDRHFRLAALRILGLAGGQEAVRSLLGWIGVADREERTGVLTALSRCDFTPGPGEVAALEARLDLELRDAAEGFAALADVAAWESSAEARPRDRESVLEGIASLESALEEEIRSVRHRLFLLLSFLRPEGDLLTAWENYASGARERRAYALELLDSHLTAEERGRVFPVLEEQELEERLQALGRSGAARRLGARDRIARLAADEGLSPWTRLCARRVGESLGASVEPLEDPEVELFGMTTRLRGVELFAELPAAVLARMVPKLQGVAAEPGTTVIRKGEEGDGMYVILEGRVRVHDEGRELAILDRDKVFGEFTVLQRMPRTASVTALEETRLLKFTQEDLQELMAEEVAVARALIRVILRRLRRNLETAAGQPPSNRGEVSPADPEAPG